jgi:hypothetical protein
MGLAILAARVTCGTIAVAPRKDTVARAREALPGYWIFISFAHEDEALKNAPIQNHGSLKNWFAVLWRRVARRRGFSGRRFMSRATFRVPAASSSSSCKSLPQ